VTYCYGPNVSTEPCEAGSMAAGQPITGAQPGFTRIDVSAAKDGSGAPGAEAELLEVVVRMNTGLVFPLDSQIGFRYVPGGYVE
jgi:hypothetical protein